MSSLNTDILGESYTTQLFHKPFFEKIQSYIPENITPNQITITNFILLIYFYNTDLYKNPYIFSIFIFIFVILDGVDGVHARATNQKSKLGELLDHGLDPIRSIILLILFCKLFKINDEYKKYLLIITIITFNVFHLVSKYTNNYAYGTKYFSIDDLNILIMLIPLLFLTKIPDMISNNNPKIMGNLLIVILIIYNLYLINYIKNKNLSKKDIFIFILVNIASYFSIKNESLLMIINFLYPLYCIYYKK